MCTGALLWSGVTRLVYAATRRDVETLLGFDEGPLPRRWRSALAGRGIAVAPVRLRRESCAVLRLYREKGSLIYASRGPLRGPSPRKRPRRAMNSR
jgi:hypothetical protein